MRLLRPVNPIVHYAVEQLAHVPVRALFSMPVALLFFFLDPHIHAPRDPALWVLFTISVLGAWAISFLVNVIIGSLAFFMEQSVKIMDVYTAVFFVLSGYMVPLDLFPEPVRAVLDFLPFRYQMGLSVELLTGALDAGLALRLVLQQWCMVLAMTLLAHGVFRRGVGHFEAYGG
jgi:ABC-2 type transport system permease protein